MLKVTFQSCLLDFVRSDSNKAPFSGRYDDYFQKSASALLQVHIQTIKRLCFLTLKKKKKIRGEMMLTSLQESVLTIKRKRECALTDSSRAKK